MCYIAFFSANSAVTVIISFGDYIFTIYDMVIIRHHFQLWCPFCNQTNQLLCFICMYMHYTAFFSVNAAITVIMSSEDYIFTIYDMVVIFQLWCPFCNQTNHIQ